MFKTSSLSSFYLIYIPSPKLKIRIRKKEKALCLAQLFGGWLTLAMCCSHVGCHTPVQLLGTALSSSSLTHICNGCSESSAFYSILLAQDIKGGCWWDGSRGWTFPPISCSILLPYDRWQQRGSMTEEIWYGSVCAAKVWKWGLRKDVSLNTFKQRKLHPLTFVMFSLLNFHGDQTVGASKVRRWMMHFSSGDGNSGSPPQVTGADFYDHDVQALVHHWQKCIGSGGTYIKKNNVS